MIALDVNVLVYAHRRDTDDHDAYRDWLERTVDAELPFGVADLVLSGFLRVVTNPRVFVKPTPLEQALAVVEELRSRPNYVSLTPGARHWGLFTSLCRTADARGNLVADAYLAAIAIETGSEWITADRDYARFPGLRWRHPFA
jgi:toxin-antitoxin system PIN domain toxin